MRIINKHTLLCAVIAICIAFALTGCKEDKPPPSTSGYYSGPMKPKAASSGKTDDATPTGSKSDSGPNTTKNKAGDP